MGLCTKMLRLGGSKLHYEWIQPCKRSVDQQLFRHKEDKMSSISHRATKCVMKLNVQWYNKSTKDKINTQEKNAVGITSLQA